MTVAELISALIRCGNLDKPVFVFCNEEILSVTGIDLDISDRVDLHIISGVAGEI